MRLCHRTSILCLAIEQVYFAMPLIRWTSCWTVFYMVLHIDQNTLEAVWEQGTNQQLFFMKIMQKGAITYYLCAQFHHFFWWCFNVCLPCLLLTIHSLAASEVVWNILQQKKKTEEETYQMEYWTAIFDYLVVRHTSELSSFHYWDVLAVDCFWLCCVQNCDPVFHLWWSDLKGTECVIQPDVAVCGLQDVKIQSLSNCWKCSIVILMCAYVLLCRILKGM